VAPMNQESRNNSTDRRAQQRRLVLLLGAAFALLAWGPRAVHMLEKGWFSSCRTLERQHQVDAASQRIDALQREVAYARTSEGRDVEAKRRFGVGPRDEIWITVEAERAREQRREPQSIADRLDAWLASAGSRAVDHVREFGETAGYAVGLNDVDQCVPVPAIEDDEPVEATDDDDAPPGERQSGERDGEAAADGSEQR